MSRGKNSANGDGAPSLYRDSPQNEDGGIAPIRQKLRRFGAKTLSNTELLALAINRTGRARNTWKLAEQALGAPGSNHAGLDLKAWRAIPGVGSSTACRMVAAFELARRLVATPADEPHIGSPSEAYALVRDLRGAKKEHLVALYLDAQNRLICRETVSVGSLNTTRTHPREVLHPAIVNSALAFILVHNHPSGSLDPSQDDVAFTRAMARAGELMGISLYDHLIVSCKGYVSLKERGIL